ncbi:hypothetical protein PAHAL_7G289900 [Panicum hallii]|uniref:Uncharacterized protein n=1 Tax=Panicum hallii TaxID=206008 RepID=A0A2T8IDV4_9POAL|nr:hypothetical protein PAHAL_7G289900 [Panicum hallii]
MCEHSLSLSSRCIPFFHGIVSPVPAPLFFFIPARGRLGVAVPALLTRSAPSLSGGGAACGPLRRRPPSLPAPRRQLLPLLPGGRPLLCGRLRRRQLLLLLPGRLEARGGKSPASSLSGPKLVPARPHCCTSSGDSGMAGYSASSSLRIRDPTQAPELHVGAVYWPSVARRAHPGILSAFSCTACGLWIWEGVLNVYAGEVVEYLQLEGRKSKDVPKLNCGCGRPFASLGTQTPNQSRWLHCKVHGQSTQEQELRLVYTLYCIKNFDGGDKIHTTDRVTTAEGPSSSTVANKCSNNSFENVSN